MSNFPQFGFQLGYVPDLPPDLTPEGSIVGEVGDSKNFRVVDGHLEAAVGYDLMQTAALLGTPLLTYKFQKDATTDILLVFTSTDIYRWDNTNLVFKFATEIYNTGTASCAGGTTVEGTGTDFVTAAIAAGDQVGFGNNDPNSITTWYTVSSVTDLDTLELTANGPNTGGAGNYVIRKVYAASATNRWEATTFYDAGDAVRYCIATNGNDIPIQWDGDTSTPSYFADMHADTPKARHVGSFGGRVIFGNVTAIRGSGVGIALGEELIWSGISDIDEWDGSGTSGSMELYETSGDIMFLAPFANNLCACKDDAVVLIQSTGRSGTPFVPVYVVKGEGADIPVHGRLGKSLIGIITENDIKIFDGTILLKTIADARIRKTFFEELNKDKKDEIHSVIDPFHNAWRIFTPSRDSTTCDQCWVYSIDDDLWQYDEIAMATAGVYRYSSGTTVSALGKASGATDYTLATPGAGVNESGDSAVQVKEAISGEAATGYIEVNSDSYYYSSKTDGTKTFNLGTDPLGACPATLSQSYSEDDPAFVATVTVDSLDVEVDSYSASKPFDNVILVDYSGYVFYESQSLKTRDDTSGTANNIDSIVELQDVLGTDLDSVDRWTQTITHYKDTGDTGDSISMTVSVDDGETYEPSQSIAMTTSTKRSRQLLGWNKSGRVCRARYSGRHFTIYGTQYFYEFESIP